MRGRVGGGPAGRWARTPLRASPGCSRHTRYVLEPLGTPLQFPIVHIRIRTKKECNSIIIRIIKKIQVYIVMSFFVVYKRPVLVLFFLHSAGMASRGTLFGPAASQMIQEVSDNTGDACQPISESGGAPASPLMISRSVRSPTTALVTSPGWHIRQGWGAEWEGANSDT